ncbi:hypothetical protein [Streptomyces sp. NPDC048172]|uniref:hypothetical protein n=1 Tax=Streptomyces sp. NPDC048172 TaxID=3365505 RepID=UPI00371D3A70
MTTSYFLAGVMQGARRAVDAADQSYRPALRALIHRHDPGAVVHDPHELVLARHGGGQRAARDRLAALAGPRTLVRAELDRPTRQLLELFHEMARLAAASDVCVAWLPGDEPSMGTAAEMYAAYAAERTVVAITPMRHNVAVLACSTVIVPDLDAFSVWLSPHAAGERSPYPPRSQPEEPNPKGAQP